MTSQDFGCIIKIYKEAPREDNQRQNILLYDAGTGERVYVIMCRKYSAV